MTHKEAGAKSAPKTDNTKEAGAKGNPLQHSAPVAEWLKRTIPPKDPLLGAWLHTTARVLLDGPTGAGKSLLALEFAFSVALGLPFLHWAKGNTPRNVLYFDGEMGAQEVQERLADMCTRYGCVPERLFVLCSEDADNLPPFDDEGADWTNWLLSHCREHDIAFVIIDNLMSVVGASLKEEDTWKKVEPIMTALTSARVGQLWLHHTGHNKNRFYGNSQVAWKMTAAIHIEQTSQEPLGISLKFHKARSRHKSPEDYRTTDLTLASGRWSGAAAPEDDQKLDKLLRALADQVNGTPVLLRTAIFDAAGGAGFKNTRELCRAGGWLDKLSEKGCLKVTRARVKGNNSVVSVELL